MRPDRFIIWLMGPTSSGKTTLAESFAKGVRKKGKIILHYDGDEVRDFYGAGHGFSKSNRQQVVQTLVHLAKKAYDAGACVVVSALTAHEDARKYLKKNIKDLQIAYVECSIETCASRDPKGLYEKARNGTIDTLIGFNSKYVPPENPDIILNTEEKSVEELVKILTEFLYPS